jgi:ribokinase
VIGSVNRDLTMLVPRLPRAGETVIGGTLLVDRGGKGANQAVAARRLGADVRMVGCVGEDDAGDDLRDALAVEGIDVEGLVTVPDVPTGTALILVDPEGRNQIAVASGANDQLTSDMVRRQETTIAWAQVLLCQLETPLPAVRCALEVARDHGVTVVLNPAPAQPLGDDVLALVHYLTPNEIEAAMLSGIEARDLASAREAAERLVSRGVRRVIVTLGHEGALVCDRGPALHFPAFPVQAIDTTAAGDAFNGALAVGLAAGGTIEQAIPLASAAAALTCTKRGAQASLPGRADVERFLQSLRRT